MSNLAAFAHIGGAVVALVALSWLALLVELWTGERNAKRIREEVATTLGITVQDLEGDHHLARVVEISAHRSSSELLRNRLSDLCGSVLTAVAWGVFLLICVVVIAVTWFTITESKDNATYAWTAVGIFVALIITSLGSSLICRVLTGRYPGEAKQARKWLAAFLQKRRDDQQKELLRRYKKLQKDLDGVLEHYENQYSFGYVSHALEVERDHFHLGKQNVLQLPLLQVHENNGKKVLRISRTYSTEHWKREENLEYAEELWTEIKNVRLENIPDDVNKQTHALYDRLHNIKEERGSRTGQGDHLLKLWHSANHLSIGGLNIIVDDLAPKEKLERTMGLKFEPQHIFYPDGDKDEWEEAHLHAPEQFLEHLVRLFPKKVFVSGNGWCHEQRSTERKAA